MSFYLFLVSLNCLVCLALFATNVQRVFKMNGETRFDVRASIITMAVLALASAVSPFMPEWGVVLGWPQVLLTAAVLAVQLATGRVWNWGVPRSLQTGQRPAYRGPHHA